MSSTSGEDESDLSATIAACLSVEAEQDKFGRGEFTVYEACSAYGENEFELVVGPEYGESAQAQRYRVTVELIKE